MRNARAKWSRPPFNAVKEPYLPRLADFFFFFFAVLAFLETFFFLGLAAFFLVDFFFLAAASSSALLLWRMSALCALVGLDIGELAFFVADGVQLFSRAAVHDGSFLLGHA